MFHAGWVFHPVVFAPAPGAEEADVATGAWYRPITLAVCSRAQARRPPPPGGLVLGGAASAPPAPPSAAVKKEQ
eukprot:3894516-Alexandrium_andersonii.AAC.1